MGSDDLRVGPDLSVAEATQLLATLEQNPGLVVSHWQTLEALIASCMDFVFKASNPKDKMLLSALEYRARLLRQRIKQGPN